MDSHMGRRHHVIHFTGIIILALILVLPFHYQVSKLFAAFLPNQEITISVAGAADGSPAPVTIYYEGKVQELFLLLKEAANENDNWVYHEGEPGVSWTYVSSNMPGASLSFPVKPLITSYFCFEGNGRNGRVIIETAYSEEIVDTRTRSGNTELIRVLPFDDAFPVQMVNILAWVIPTTIFAIFLLLLSKIEGKGLFVRIALVSIIAIVYLLQYSTSTSPMYPNNYGYDSAFFILVGKGMKYGYLPYRDFYDMKGPWLFTLEWLGQLVAEGRLGAFLLQCVNMIGAMLMFDMLLGMHRKKRDLAELGLLMPMLLTAVFSVGGGNLTEELSLFPLSIVLYFGVKYLTENEINHNPFYAGIYGFFFGMIALIRITNAALLGAVVLTIVIVLITKKAWVNLAKNAVAFVLGCLVAVLPIVIFLPQKGCCRIC